MNGYRPKPTTPRPEPLKGTKIICEHKFVYLETNKKRDMGHFNHDWYREDLFFCEKCLEYKTKTMHESSRDIPIWWR